VRARRGVLYLANLDPRAGTEPGKVRPVLVVQTDLLNDAGHPSTWVLPCTTRLTGENLLRVELPAGIAGNRDACEVMVDQSRAIDDRRLVKMLKPLPPSILAEVVEKLRKLGDLSAAPDHPPRGRR
jgi:mRNA interferase MazF